MSNRQPQDPRDLYTPIHVGKIEFNTEPVFDLPPNLSVKLTQEGLIEKAKEYQMQSMNDTSNPKDIMASTKCRVDLLSPEFIYGVADAMNYGAHLAPKKDGGKGYGEFNWRQTKVRESVYACATIRHALKILAGEDIDPDSGLSHWSHIGANANIAIDARAEDCLIDDRHKSKKFKDATEGSTQEKK